MAHDSSFRFAIAAVDAVLFAIRDGLLMTLVRPVEAGSKHYAGLYGFPGGVMRPEENAEQALARHLKDKVSIDSVYVEQLYTFTDVNRDKRSRSVAIAYLGLVPLSVIESYTHDTAKWVPVKKVGTLAYDHNEMLTRAHTRLAGKLLYTTIARQLLPKSFTLTELQTVYEVVRAETFDKRNFRKKLLALDILEETGEVQSGVQNRPAALYRFKGSTVAEIPLIA